ncbi:toll-like receptor 7 [Mytilus trossulus]|uniref:toll-like receptor 7 n=1 Tax=Mytilus trossulus TaxID=6551 RepID=UPI003005573A
MRHIITFIVMTIVQTVFVEPKKYLSCHYQSIHDSKNDSFGNSSNHGPVIPITVRLFTSNGECVFNPKAITDKYIRQDYFQGVFLIIWCYGSAPIHFVFPSEITVPFNTFGIVLIKDCQFDGRQINLLLQLTNSRHLYLQNTNILRTAITPWFFCALKQLIVLGIFYIKGYVMETLDNLLSCEATLPQMQEFYVSSCGKGTINTTVIENKFRYLRYMMITNCRIEMPVLLKFTNTPKNRRSNISNKDEGDHGFRFLKMFNYVMSDVGLTSGVELRSNSLKNYEQIHISGHVNSVKITQNYLFKITADIIADAKGLQIISFSQNNILEIKNDTFKGHFDVEHIDLSNNTLRSLPDKIFYNMHKLKFVSLARNKLITLPRNIFATLNELSSLDMEGNSITHIQRTQLPSNNLKLSYINLNYNPIVELPVAIFYIEGLKTVDLKYTQITFSTLWSILETLDQLSFILSISPGIDISNGADFNSFPDKASNFVWRIVDLTGCKVSGFDWTEDQRNTTALTFAKTKLRIILSYFRFVLTDNPIDCFSNNIVFLIDLVSMNHKNGIFSGKEYFFSEWLCENPIEFRGRPLFDIKPDDTYYKMHDTYCPIECACFFRYNQSITIVDCRGVNLSSIPDSVPPGLIDLWLQNNNISMLNFRPYFKKVRQLYMSSNRLRVITYNVFSEMKKLKFLKIDRNFLSYLPKTITSLNLEEIYIDHNPLLCDCNSLWLKYWMFDNILVLKKLDDIRCRSFNGIEKFLKVPNEKFTCAKTFAKSFVAEIVGTLVGIAAMCLLTIAIVFRQSIRVLLYFKFGFHTFDRQFFEDYETIDITFVYSKMYEDFIKKKSKVLEKFVVCYSTEHFVPGYALDTNIRNAVHHSKYVFILVTDDIETNIINSTYAACEQKFEKRIDFLLGFVNTNRNIDEFEISDGFKRYFKLHQTLKPNNMLFWENLSYKLASSRDRIRTENEIELNHNIEEHLCFKSNVCDTASYDAFVCYMEEDTEYSEIKLKMKLKEITDYKIVSIHQIAPGYEWFPSIEKCLDKSRHTIFVVSNNFNEWQSERYYAFRMAQEKTNNNNENHLIVVFRGKKTTKFSEKDFEKYFQKFVFLEHVEGDEVNEVEFWRRMKAALKSKRLANGAPLECMQK